MPDSQSRRPAHRPSRRRQLIDGAVELFAVKPPELVTIAETVRAAGMTPAAFYYHFSSREELLQEMVDLFGDEWAERAEHLWAEATSVDDVISVVGRLLDWAIEQRDRATVFFVNARGATVGIENTRRAVSARIAAAAGEAISRATGTGPSARTAVDGVALATVLESALRAELTLDTAYRTLGPRRFRDEVAVLCMRVLGVAEGIA